MKDNEGIISIEVTPEHSGEMFFEKMRELGFTTKFNIKNILSPVYYFREEFIKHIAENGLNSLLTFDIGIEDITSPSISIDGIVDLIVKFVEKITPIKKLIIVDSYFYSGDESGKTHELFVKLIGPALLTIEELIVISKNPIGPMQKIIHTELKEKLPNIIIIDKK